MCELETAKILRRVRDDPNLPASPLRNGGQRRRRLQRRPVDDERGRVRASAVFVSARVPSGERQIILACAADMLTDR